ncbi:NaeI family type II restriction endonuclease [Streptomyces coeruleoprunus]|uniref:NaeI family type II restriction endonuclease n=1 Tax=Streptomyces coeruleoprunus TaxID=285563 RepID=A0ABV9XIV1_9ACTN
MRDVPGTGQGEPTPGPTSVDGLRRALAALRAAVPDLDTFGDLDGTQLAEALWLAARMTQGAPAGARPAPRPHTAGASGTAEGAPPPEPPAAPERSPEATDPDEPSSAGAADAGTERPLHERLPGSGTRVRGHAVAAPRATVLPRALEVTRALRPWKRVWPEGRRSELDVEATVDGYARSGELIPVFGAGPERWFDLTLVVDRSPGMRVWQETIGEFTAVLDRLGAFRTLQLRDLVFDGDGLPRTPGPLRSADGRTLVVVVSDCAAAPWREPEVWRLLREWAGATPTALLNPLPTKLWRRGGLNLPTVRFTPTAPGAHRSRVPHEPPPLLGVPEADASGAWLPIPVLSLSPHSLDRWSRTMMRGDPEGCTAVLVPPGGRLRDGGRPRSVPVSPATLAEGFLRTAAPRAARLAVLCAPFDRMSLSLLHIVRRELVPDATTADVAEVVTSGLFRLEQDGEGPVELLLSAEARAILRERLPAHEAWRVHQALDRHVASRGDGRTPLPAVASGGDGPQDLRAEREAFAHASRQVLEMLGLAEQQPPRQPQPQPQPQADDAVGHSGEETGDGPATPPGRSTLPPPPTPFVGRVTQTEELVRSLSAPSGQVHCITALDDTPGAGRTALALHVAHRVAEHYPDGRFYVDVRGSRGAPLPADAVIHQLLRDLGAPVGDGPPRDQESLVAALRTALRGRRALFVLDDVPRRLPFLAALVEQPGCATVVTAPHAAMTDVRPGFTTTLAPLTPSDASALLTAAAEAVQASLAEAAHDSLRELMAVGSWWPLAVRLLGACPALWYTAELRSLRAAFPADRTGAVLTLLSQALPDRLRRTLTSLAPAESGEVTPTEAAALLGASRAEALVALNDLVAQGLLEDGGGSCFRFPKAVQHHVRTWAVSPQAQHEASARLLRLYLAAAAALYEESRPGSRLAARLGVEPSPQAFAPDEADLWLSNALAFVVAPFSERTAELSGCASLLLLLVDLARGTPYASRYAHAAEALWDCARRAEPEAGDHLRVVVAVAHARHAAGRPEAEVAALLRAISYQDLSLDTATRGLTTLLFGRLAEERQAWTEAERDFRTALAHFRHDGDRHGAATAALSLARTLVRTFRPDEAVYFAEEVLAAYPDPGGAHETREALLCLERALLDAGRRGELLGVQRRMRDLFRSDGDRRAEGAVLVRTARTLLALARPDEAVATAREALAYLDESDASAEREEVLRLLDTARAREAAGWLEPVGAAPGAPVARGTGPASWTIVAIDTVGGGSAAACEAPLIRTLEASGSTVASWHTRAAADHCLLFVDRTVALDALLALLTERLPSALEAEGQHPAVRLAVHTGTADPRAGDVTSELDVELALTMLRSAAFRGTSANFPLQPTLCLSPEAYADVTSEGGLLGRHFAPREVTSPSGTVTCVVLTPRIDLSAYDADVLALARVFGELDPDGRRMAKALRDCIDTALAPEATGRFDLAQLDAGERALLGRGLESALCREFPFRPGTSSDLVGSRRGAPPDLVWDRPGRSGPLPFELKFSRAAGAWMFDSRADGRLCLLVHADESHSLWSAGLLRVRPELLTPTRNRDSLAALRPEAREAAVLWLHRQAPLPENVLLHMAAAQRERILAGPTAVARTAEFFRQVRGRTVRDAALRAVTRRQDSSRRVREAAAVLRDEGILVLGGNRRGRELAAALGLPVPEADEYVSVALTRRRPHHTRPSIVAGGVAWVVAGRDDPAEPLPQDLPSPRRPR